MLLRGFGAHDQQARDPSDGFNEVKKYGSGVSEAVRAVGPKF